MNIEILNSFLHERRGLALKSTLNGNVRAWDIGYSDCPDAENLFLFRDLFNGRGFLHQTARGNNGRHVEDMLLPPEGIPLTSVSVGRNHLRMGGYDISLRFERRGLHREPDLEIVFTLHLEEFRGELTVVNTGADVSYSRDVREFDSIGYGSRIARPAFTPTFDDPSPFSVPETYEEPPEPEEPKETAPPLHKPQPRKLGF